MPSARRNRAANVEDRPELSSEALDRMTTQRMGQAAVHRTVVRPRSRPASPRLDTPMHSPRPDERFDKQPVGVDSWTTALRSRW